MIVKGGFLIISLDDQNITISSGITVTGIYTNLANNVGRKVVYLTNITIDDTAIISQIVSCIKSGDNYVLSFLSGSNAYALTITSADAVTLTVTDLSATA